ncbi:hypothetical protein J6590_008673 [Homalodisca vitripennis]|nr:hypothetical protein J6590_008673 [Homalodisca vitripennis]
MVQTSVSIFLIPRNPVILEREVLAGHGTLHCPRAGTPGPVAIHRFTPGVRGLTPAPFRPIAPGPVGAPHSLCGSLTQRQFAGACAQ